MTDETETPETDTTQDTTHKTWTEQIEVAGEELVARIKQLVAEGNVRHLKIKAHDGDLVLEMPLTIGAIAGGAVVLAAPFLAVLGALAAFVARVKIEVTRDDDTPKQ